MKATLYIPIYNCQLDIVLTNKFKEAAEKAGFKESCDGWEGLTIHYPSCPSLFCVIFNKKTLDAEVIAHEALHVTSKIMRECDIKYDTENIEPFAYLHGYIVKELHKILFGDGK